MKLHTCRHNHFGIIPTRKFSLIRASASSSRRVNIDLLKKSAGPSW
jgi:hypothetical protein